MTKDEIIEMARQAGFEEHQAKFDTRFEPFAKLVAEKAIKEALAQTEEEKLHPVYIGVDVTKEGAAVTAFYRKPNAVMEMFYSQFHPLAQPEQEPVAYLSNKRQRINIEIKPQTFVEIPTVTDWEMPLYMKPPQRTWVDLTRAQFAEILCDDRWQGRPELMLLQAQSKLKEKNNG